MNYFDDYADHYDDREYNPQNKKRSAKRRWRDIERFKERRALSREIVRDDYQYFDLLEAQSA